MENVCVFVRFSNGNYMVGNIGKWEYQGIRNALVRPKCRNNGRVVFTEIQLIKPKITHSFKPTY